MKKLNRFFWWCAGVNIDILEECPTEHSKYFGIGGTVFFTASMASLAGGYAFFTAFKESIWAIFFGIFWGLLIFNLDRYIVSTIGKGNGTQKITKDEWKGAAPRLIMAVLLGFVIATPLELKIFDAEIKTVLEGIKIDRGEELKGRDISVIKDYEDAKLRLAAVQLSLTELTNNKLQLTENAGKFLKEHKNELIQDLEHKTSELNTAQRRVNSYHSSYQTSIRDSLSSDEIASRKFRRDREISKRDQIRNDKNKIDQQITELNRDIEGAIEAEQEKIDKQISLLVKEKESLLNNVGEIEKTIATKRANYDDKVADYDGLAAHLEAMSILTAWEHEPLRIPAIFWAKWLITILFIFIEVAPVLFKLMTESGPYDDIIARIKHKSSARTKQKMLNLDHKVDRSIKASKEKNQTRLNAELKWHKERLDKIELAQAEIADVAVKRWKEEELERLETSVEHIIDEDVI